MEEKLFLEQQISRLHRKVNAITSAEAYEVANSTTYTAITLHSGMRRGEENRRFVHGDATVSWHLFER